MVRKLIFAAFLLAYGIWLVSHPARTAGLNEWGDCMSIKGLVCIPKLPRSSHERAAVPVA
jgi:hypothetical protein